MAGERQEDVVERRAADADVVDADRRLVEVAHDLDEAHRAAVGGYRQAAGVLVDRGLPVAVPVEHLDGPRDVRPVADDDLDPLAADLPLELVGGARAR